MAAGKGSKPDEFDEWLEAPTQQRKPCGVCKNHPRTVAATRKYLEARVDGRTSQSISALHRFCEEKLGMTMGRHALSNHCKRCERELYDQL